MGMGMTRGEGMKAFVMVANIDFKDMILIPPNMPPGN
jgi:hypothetical protein